MIHGRRVENPRTADETIESQNPSQNGEIINLQLGNVTDYNNNLKELIDSRGSSGSPRYKENDELEEIDETIDFGELINGSKTANESLIKVEKVRH